MSESTGTELGKALGKGLSDASDYKQDFIETADQSDINLVDIESVGLSGSYFINKYNVGNHFVLGHPVLGNLGFDPLLAGVYNLNAGSPNDLTANAINGTVTGATVISSGIFGSAYRFSGGGAPQFISYGSSAALTPTGAFTFAAWVKPSVTSSNYKAISKGNSTCSMGINGNLFEFAVYDSSWRLAYSTGTPSTTAWSHVSGVWGGPSDKAVKLYVNGVISSALFNSAAYIASSSTDALRIGANPDSSNPWIGDIAETAYWRRALSAQEVSDLYNNGLGYFYPNSIAHGVQLGGSGALDPALVAMYKLDGDTTDATGNGYNGTVSGATVTASSLHGSAYLFNGSSDYIAINDNTNLRLAGGQGSVSAWFWPRSAGSNTAGRIIDKSTDTVATNGYNLRTNTPSGSTFGLALSLQGVTAIQLANTYLSPSTWYHAIATYNGSTAKLYVNGVMAGSAVSGVLHPSNVAGSIYIGNRAGATDRAFDGIIEEVGIWNRCLTQDDVTTLYRDGLSRYYPDTIGYGLTYGLRANDIYTSGLL